MVPPLELTWPSLLVSFVKFDLDALTKLNIVVALSLNTATEKRSVGKSCSEILRIQSFATSNFDLLSESSGNLEFIEPEISRTKAASIGGRWVAVRLPSKLDRNSMFTAISPLTLTALGVSKSLWNRVLTANNDWWW